MTKTSEVAEPIKGLATIITRLRAQKHNEYLHGLKVGPCDEAADLLSEAEELLCRASFSLSPETAQRCRNLRERIIAEQPITVSEVEMIARLSPAKQEDGK